MVTGLKHAIAFVLNRKIIINSNTPNLVAQRDPFEAVVLLNVSYNQNLSILRLSLN